MLVVGVDPGVTTGIASYALINDRPIVQAIQTQHWKEIANFLDELQEIRNVVVVIEDFIGQGFRNPHNNQTLKTIGFTQGLSLYLGYETVIVQPQQRIHKLKEAEALLQKSSGRFPKHACDALAHAINYWRKVTK